MSSVASDALHQLSALMQLREQSELSTRLERRALEMRFMPELCTEPQDQDEDSDEAQLEQKKWERYGLQLKEDDDNVLPPAVQAMMSIADMHASRHRLDEAIRIMERALELEEQRCGALDARLVPILVRYAAYVEDAGRLHEAQALRLRATELRELKIAPSSLRVPS